MTKIYDIDEIQDILRKHFLREEGLHLKELQVHVVDKPRIVASFDESQQTGWTEKEPVEIGWWWAWIEGEGTPSVYYFDGTLMRFGKQSFALSQFKSFSLTSVPIPQ